MWMWFLLILILVIISAVVYFYLSGGSDISDVISSGKDVIPQPPALPK